MKSSESVLDKISSDLPALHKAFEINKAVTSVGFDWSCQDDRWKKVEEELEEVKQEIRSGHIQNLELEIGDLLFSLVSVFAAEGVSAEVALQKACEKFNKRFRHVEKLANEKQCSLKSLTLSELECLWKQAKVSTQ
jgi:uncharacterized protein YabN with tetrapyrrole methylase and pyrophosphatase domain